MEVLRVSALQENLSRGQGWLTANSKNLLAETATGLTFKDNFLELLILEATGNWRLVDLPIPSGKWNYFGSKAVVVAEGFYPDDVDTQAIGGTVIPRQDAEAHALMDEMLARATNDEGIIQMYYEKDRPRTCPEVVADVLTFFYAYDRGHELRKNLDYVYSVLQNRSHHPTRYYFMPEAFLYYIYRLVKSSDAVELKKLRELLIARVQERVGTESGNAVCIAIRLLISHAYKIPNQEDLANLLRLQEQDGSYGVGWYYAFGRTNIKIGHRGFTCALSTEALKLYIGDMISSGNISCSSVVVYAPFT